MATPEQLKDLDSILRRLEQANQALYKTVDKELRTIIQAQLTELKLEKDLIKAKIDVYNKVDGAHERVTRSQEALDALLLPAAAPVGLFGMVGSPLSHSLSLFLPLSH